MTHHNWLGHTRRALPFIVTWLVLLSSFVGACSSSNGGTTGKTCVGGVMRNGVCEGKCTPDKCLPNNTCVDNRCVLKCASELDCFTDGSQNCVAAKEDDTSADITICEDNGKASGYGNLCAFGTECAMLMACPNGAPCGGSQCMGQPDKCQLDDIACQGVMNCTIGRCPAELGGLPCALMSACADNECLPMTCITKGPGDADAYCTKNDCQKDDDCPGGYYCGITRDPHDICGNTCNKTAGTCSQDATRQCTGDSDCQKGNNTLCGTTKDPCIDPSTFTQNGETYFEGQKCLLRKTCIKRDQCDPCNNDLDCSRHSGQKCVNVVSSMRCARDCAMDSDCNDDYHCVSNSCVPRDMHGCGAPTSDTNLFCRPCNDDTDCGPADPAALAKGNFVCWDVGDGMKACFDSRFPNTCSTDADCPVAPSGKHGACLDERFQVASTDPSYHICYFPFKTVEGIPSFTCW